MLEVDMGALADDGNDHPIYFSVLCLVYHLTSVSVCVCVCVCAHPHLILPLVSTEYNVYTSVLCVSQFYYL